MKDIRVVAFFLCLSVLGAPLFVLGQDVESRRAVLQKDLENLEDEIAEQQVILDERKQESASLERDVAILDATITKAKLSIERRDLAIDRLTGEIGSRTQAIGDLTDELAREKESLAQIIRRTQQIDDTSLVEIMFGNEDLSEVLEDLDAFDAIEASLQESFDVIEDTKEVAQVERVSLEAERTQELELRELQDLEKQKIEREEAAKAELLRLSRGVEAQYQAIINVKEQNAAQIRAELFRLRGSAAIPFGQALELAQKAELKTGTRAALVLGTLQQETRLGEFLGNGNWRVDMHPTRDQPIFEGLMESIGLDPDSVPVSAAPSYGWGGAMGPAQFIPSTWVLYAGYSQGGDGKWHYNKADDRIGALTGNQPPNPYEPEDAFMASSLLLADNGASEGTRFAERRASLRYFAGWVNADNPSYAFYGDEVMQLADGYQRQIDILEGA